MSEQAAGNGIKTLGGFFHLLEIDAAEAGNHPEAFAQLRLTKYFHLSNLCPTSWNEPSPANSDSNTR